MANIETGVIYCADNMDQLAALPSESVDLIYLDPPFFSNRNYEVIWGDEAEVRSFEDRWDGGMDHYIAWMEDRVREMYRLLKDTGSLYLHCDWHASHYLKVMLDRVFDESDFRNEVAWCYRGGGVSKRWWARKHDVIFFYTKGKTWTFNPQYTAYSESTVAVTSRGAGQKGQRVNKTEIDLDRGGHMPDWWTDINSLQTWSPERIGYPTQKPVALLERIITASSNEGDVVLDPFCGCGTTLQAAHNLKRQWVGIDISPTAVNVMVRQLARKGITARAIGLPVTEADLRALKPLEFQNWVIDKINGTHSNRKVHDMGIDGYSFFVHEPVQVKQSDGIGRNVIDNFETAMRRDSKTKGHVIAFSFGKGARGEVARAKAKEGLTIELVTVADLLGGAHPLVSPPGTMFGPALATPEPRAVDTLPTVEELVASEKGEAIVDDDEE